MAMMLACFVVLDHVADRPASRRLHLSRTAGASHDPAVVGRMSAAFRQSGDGSGVCHRARTRRRPLRAGAEAPHDLVVRVGRQLRGVAVRHRSPACPATPRASPTTPSWWSSVTCSRRSPSPPSAESSRDSSANRWSGPRIAISCCSRISRRGRRRHLTLPLRLSSRDRNRQHSRMTRADEVVAGHPFVVAHRGASSARPEHTLAAYDVALKQGADGVECDVRLTRDGHLVCVHDRRLDRTSTGRGFGQHGDAGRAS